MCYEGVCILHRLHDNNNTVHKISALPINISALCGQAPPLTHLFFSRIKFVYTHSSFLLQQQLCEHFWIYGYSYLPIYVNMHTCLRCVCMCYMCLYYLHKICVYVIPTFFTCNCFVLLTPLLCTTLYIYI